MTLDEIFRRIVRGHLLVILVCVAVPLAAVAVLESRTSLPWVATVRIQVTTQNPGSTTEADALSSRVLALATTPSLVDAALDDADVTGNARKIAASGVTSQRLGESPVVDLSVTMADRGDARALVVALADQIIQFMNDATYTRFDEALQQTTDKLDAATKVRDDAAQKLRAAVDANAKAELRTQVQEAQATIDQLAAAKASMELAGLERDEVVLIDGAHPDVVRATSTLVPRSALGLILGLLVGIAVAVTLETLNPKVPGTRALARMLSAPVLGNTDHRRAAVVNAMTFGARRHGVETIVLLGVDDADDRAVEALLDDLRETRGAARPRTPVTAQAHRRRHDGADPASSGSSEEAADGAADTAETGDTADTAAEGGPSIPSTVRFSDLAGVTPAQAHTAGVVVVTSGSPRHRDVDGVEDVLKTMRWPVVGVIEARNHASRKS